MHTSLLQAFFDLPGHIVAALQDPGFDLRAPRIHTPIASTTYASTPLERPLTEGQQKRVVKRNKAANNTRAKKRQKESKAADAYVRARAHSKLIDKSAPAHCDLQTENIPVSSTGYIALNQGPTSDRAYTLEDLVGEQSEYKFRLIKHTGESTPIVDASNHVIGVIANHPNDPYWQDLQRQASAAIEARRDRCCIPIEDETHRRGAFISLNCGVSHGGGRKMPGNVKNSKPNAEVLAELNAMEPFQRFSSFASSVMYTWANQLYQYYATTLSKLHSKHPKLRRIFPDSIFSAVSYNFGPWTTCFQHKDFANLAFGWCAVTALGDFDYTAGGHLILWELKIVIEFPPGCTILFPSALITHSNVPIKETERRYSFAQYTAGGIFRWVENNFMTRERYLAKLTREQRAQDEEANATRWKLGLSLLSTSNNAKTTA
ncbi:hypothetical protein JR316_0001628 [Psilocybe cubensis]|uniref:Uncharacterized protein n=2 Tax=Psilocybe cubensis TaxID=181762 RepID=A0A8H7Y3I9_PSICU|nr:hypothetical protein JR316_0001628 [Psilocybe cubensis]KAH9484728.1 hypothetical protein JR316_0001628 [Psilocybe cubensis]